MFAITVHLRQGPVELYNPHYLSITKHSDRICLVAEHEGTELTQFCNAGSAVQWIQNRDPDYETNWDLLREALDKAVLSVSLAKG